MGSYTALIFKSLALVYFLEIHAIAGLSINRDNKLKAGDAKNSTGFGIPPWQTQSGGGNSIPLLSAFDQAVTTGEGLTTNWQHSNLTVTGPTAMHPATVDMFNQGITQLAQDQYMNQDTAFMAQNPGILQPMPLLPGAPPPHYQESPETVTHPAIPVQHVLAEDDVEELLEVAQLPDPLPVPAPPLAVQEPQTPPQQNPPIPEQIPEHHESVPLQALPQSYSDRPVQAPPAAVQETHISEQTPQLGATTLPLPQQNIPISEQSAKPQEASLGATQGWTQWVPQNELGWHQSVNGGQTTAGSQILSMTLQGNQANFVASNDVSVQVETYGHNSTSNVYYLGAGGPGNQNKDTNQPLNQPASQQLQFQF